MNSCLRENYPNLLFYMTGDFRSPVGAFLKDLEPDYLDFRSTKTHKPDHTDMFLRVPHMLEGSHEQDRLIEVIRDLQYKYNVLLMDIGSTDFQGEVYWFRQGFFDFRALFFGAVGLFVFAGKEMDFFRNELVASAHLFYTTFLDILERLGLMKPGTNEEIRVAKKHREVPIFPNLKGIDRAP